MKRINGSNFKILTILITLFMIFGMFTGITAVKAAKTTYDIYVDEEMAFREYNGELKNITTENEWYINNPVGFSIEKPTGTAFGHPDFNRVFYAWENDMVGNSLAMKFTGIQFTGISSNLNKYSTGDGGNFQILYYRLHEVKNNKITPVNIGAGQWGEYKKEGSWVDKEWMLLDGSSKDAVL